MFVKAKNHFAKSPIIPFNINNVSADCVFYIGACNFLIHTENMLYTNTNTSINTHASSAVDPIAADQLTSSACMTRSFQWFGALMN